MSAEVRIRLAIWDDSVDLFDWRNDQVTRSFSRSQVEVAWPEHSQWYEAMLASGTRTLYIGELDDASGTRAKIGMCRFDATSESTFEVSINLNPRYRGMGYSRKLLSHAIETFYSDLDDQPTITASIRPSNIASVRLFVTSGFEKVRESAGWSDYSYRP